MLTIKKFGQQSERFSRYKFTANFVPGKSAAFKQEHASPGAWQKWLRMCPPGPRR